MPTVDLLVIGGGIHGASVARDAALRGLSVVLVEKDDLASGTSSRSSKLIHGGLRYLETGQFRLVREALSERAILFDIARAFVRPLYFMVPFYKGDARPGWLVRAGITLYDALAGRGQESHLMLSAEGARILLPALPADNLVGGAIYLDAQMDDAMLVVATAAGAARAGAQVRTRTELLTLAPVGDVWRAGLSGGEVVEARSVVNAAGPWVDLVRARAASAPAPSLRLTRGTHIVVPAITNTLGMLLFTRKDGRVFFVLPWYGRSLVGTTDTDDAHGPDAVAPTVDDIRYLWDEISQRWPHVEPERNTKRVFAGLRPLARSGSGRPWDNPREARLLMEHGMVSIVGGKYTTARLLAERAVDRVVRHLGARVAACSTATTELPFMLPRITEEGLAALRKYDPDAMVPRYFGGQKEVELAIDEQFARTLGDVLFRRTPYWIDSDLIRKVAPEFAGWMAEKLGWSDARRAEEIAAVFATLDAEERILAEARSAT